MTQSHFYAKVQAGLPGLVHRLIEHADAPPERLSMILGDTARLTGLGDPADNPEASTLIHWSQQRPPLWVARTALFLLIQMPARPTPDGDDEQAAWAYVWLRMREHESCEAAINALPPYLRFILKKPLETAWADLKGQRLL